MIRRQTQKYPSDLRRDMKHELKLSDMEDYEFKVQIAGHFGRGNSKCINAIIKNSKVRYEVVSWNKVILKTLLLHRAVEKFNE